MRQGSRQKNPQRSRLIGLIGGWLTLFILLTLSVRAFAGVYRCPDASGGITFQQRPCPQGQEVELDVQTTPWVASPKLKPAKGKQTTGRRSKSDAAALARAARAQRKQKQACWRARKQIEKIEWSLRKGYRPSRGERLKQRRREKEDYVRTFCR